MKLASRMERIGESATLRVSRRAAELRAAGVDVIDFGAGEPDFRSPDVAVAAAVDALHDGFTKYTQGDGIPALREAIAEDLAQRYGAPWQGADGMVTVGAKMALFQVWQALLDDGDEVVMPSPCWVSFPEQVRFIGGRPQPVTTVGSDGFRIHAGPILDVMSDRTRAVLINSPSNPTGGMIDAGDLRQLVEACAQLGIVLVSDETYDRFVYDGRRHASAAELAKEFPDTVVLVGSMSKTYAMTGWRLGYLYGPRTVVRAVSKIQSHSTSNPTSFAMKGAVAAIRQAQPEVEAMVAEYAERRRLLTERLAELPGVTCRPPAGAFYAFPDVSACYRDGRRGSIELAEHLLEKARVAVVPGEAFGSDDHIRISFACSTAELERGLDRIAEALAD